MTDDTQPDTPKGDRTLSRKPSPPWTGGFLWLETDDTFTAILGSASQTLRSGEHINHVRTGDTIIGPRFAFVVGERTDDVDPRWVISPAPAEPAVSQPTAQRPTADADPTDTRVGWFVLGVLVGFASGIGTAMGLWP